ncbi:hypothetical protein HYW17_04375 [Candidatus Uhrbacteria bacterium]|nr:hypothetical protein [Candidatus Uhrbacteria bacterium]
MLNPLQEQLIIGSLLGDGSLTATGGGKRYRFTVSHGSKQKEYLFWKYEILKDYVRTPPRLQSNANAWKFNTISRPEFTDLRACFYQERQKIVPDTIEHLIGIPQVMAIWYMDDGNLRREYGNIYGCMLNSHSFTYEDNQKVSRWLYQRYGLKSVLQRNHEKYRLYFGAGSWKQLCTIIAPYILPSMRYKLP